MKVLFSEVLWVEIKQSIISYDQSIKQEDKKKYGIYLTDLDLAYELVKTMIIQDSSIRLNELHQKTFFEPCVGLGSFVFAYLRVAYEMGIRGTEAEILVNNIYYSDSCDILISKFIKSFCYYVYKIWGITVSEDEIKKKNAFAGTIFDRDGCMLSQEIFKKGMRKFDMVVSNPPYKVLKVDARNYHVAADYEVDKIYYKKISSLIKSNFEKTSEGVCNLYKIFVEFIFDEALDDGGISLVLIPRSFLTEKSSYKMRSFLLENKAIHRVVCINEKNNFFSAKQALIGLTVTKNHNESILFNQNYDEQDGFVKIPNNFFLDKDAYDAVFFLRYQDFKVFSWIKKKFNKIESFNGLVNMRGEFDMSLHANFLDRFSSENDSLRLIRGRDLEPDSEKVFVHKDFMSVNSKSKYMLEIRLACPQISNMNSKNRIKFNFVDKNNIIANSCNFICVESKEDLFYFYGLLNSRFINWFFKRMSSNNHVANYEIDRLPIHTDLDVREKIKELVKKYLALNTKELLHEIDICVEKGFSIVFDHADGYTIENTVGSREIKTEQKELSLHLDNSRFFPRLDIDALNKIKSAIKSKNSEGVLNDTGFKLSDLDMDMIRCIPQGGNWKNISPEVVLKSKRLIQINNSGGRTTLYGRSDYKKPSYTISTYFNRPGNGTYIHPTQDRVLTVREAARLQSFRDDYYFVGNKRELLMQVGNAVPPLFSFQVGQKIKSKLGLIKVADLFAGAGGMSSGLAEAGHQLLIANEIDRAAAMTYKVNHASTEVILGDICNHEIKKQLVDFCIEQHTDVVCGGPPCQGFSHAGKRNVEDARNQLILEYLNVIKQVRPKLAIMENVSGFLTLDQGGFYQLAVQAFEQMGYRIKGALFDMSKYGVPQKRKRFILFAVRSDMPFQAGDFFPDLVEQQVTVFEAIADLDFHIPSQQLGDNTYLKKIKYGFLSDTDEQSVLN